MSQNIDIVVQAIDQATATLRQVQGQVASLGDQVKKTGVSFTAFAEQHKQAFQTLAVGGGIALAGITALGKGAVDQASKMQDLRQSFDTLVGSAEKGKKLFIDIQQFASKTPFDSASLAQATSTMLGFGVSQEKVMANMKQLGDIAMGNAGRLQSLSLAFGQISASGKLTGQDLLQMINAGFNPLEVIAKKTGKTLGELKKEMEKGAISAKMVEEAMKDATSEGGRFFNGMEQASKTFSGVMSTLKDNVGIALASIGGFANGEIVKGGLVDMLTQAMEKAMPYLDRFTQWASENGTLLGSIVLIGGALAGLATAIGVVGLAVPTITTGLTAIGSLIGAISWPIVAVGALIAGLGVAWSTNFLGIRDKTAQAWEWIKAKTDDFIAGMQDIWLALEQFWMVHGETIKTYFSVWITSITTALSVGWEIISTTVKVAWEIISGTIEVAFELIKGIIVTGLQILSGDWSGAWETMKETFSNVMQTMDEKANNILTHIKDMFIGIWTDIKTGVMKIVGDIETYLSSRLTSVMNIVQKIKDIAKSMVSFGQGGQSEGGIDGARANGGPVFGGGAYLVGERGPEIFRPNTSGLIIPNENISNSVTINLGGVTVNNQSDADYFVNELARRLQLSKLGIPA